MSETPKTEQELLRFVFGQAISSFDDKVRPTDFDIVKFWINSYDTQCGPGRSLDNDERCKIYHEIATSVTKNW